MHRGAKSFHLKPLKAEALTILFSDIDEFSNRKTRRLLLIGNNESDMSEIMKTLENRDLIQIEIADSDKKALQLLKENLYDCIIIYLGTEIAGMELVSEISTLMKQEMTPVLIYLAKDLSSKENAELRQFANKIILKGADSSNLLLEETIMLLHIDHKDLLPEKRKLIEGLRLKSDILTNKNVLVVDDDVRNLFALTTAFERYNINTITAESGMEAMNILNASKQIEIVLMDIMMPEMDGYETIQKIRRENKNSTLPIIAVTAKAMKGDREKCIEAGASDYITKPLKIDHLLSLMRVWLYKK